MILKGKLLMHFKSNNYTNQYIIRDTFATTWRFLDLSLPTRTHRGCSFTEVIKLGSPRSWKFPNSKFEELQGLKEEKTGRLLMNFKYQ